jgi:hypothetical protein
LAFSPTPWPSASMSDFYCTDIENAARPDHSGDCCHGDHVLVHAGRLLSASC